MLSFVLYADFEPMLAPYHDEQNLLKTNKYQNRIPYSVGYYFKCLYDDSLSFNNSYRGPDYKVWFENQLNQKIKKIIP